jgi:hypothetical protein
MANKDTHVYKAYTMLRNDADAGNDNKKLNWASHVKTMLTECGLLNVWNDQDLYVPVYLLLWSVLQILQLKIGMVM